VFVVTATEKTWLNSYSLHLSGKTCLIVVGQVEGKATQGVIAVIPKWVMGFDVERVVCVLLICVCVSTF